MNNMDEDKTPEDVALERQFGELPDRLTSDKTKPFYDKRWPKVEVYFNGNRCPDNVLEYCVSEGWIDIKIGFKGEGVKRHHGHVRPRWRGATPTAAQKRVERPRTSDLGVLEAAAAKRARKAAKQAQIAGRK